MVLPDKQEFAEAIMMTEIIGGILCAGIAVITLVISIRSFKEKGFLFNNAYIWASEKEREQMDKKPHYRQTAVVFAILTLIFLCMAIEMMVQTGWLWIVNVGFTVVAIVYAVISSAKVVK